MDRRSWVVLVGGLALCVVAFVALRRPFPSDHTPEGAYMRIAKAFSVEHPEEAFAYLETDAQWASYTIGKMRAQALSRIQSSYPEPERTTWTARYRDLAEARGGEYVFAKLARSQGWDKRLRKDLSGCVGVETSGDRATVVTARGARYSFRRRENGIWGLTMFTAELTHLSETASRDFDIVEKAANDYDRARP